MLDHIPEIMDWSGADCWPVYVTANGLHCREQPEIRPNNILTTFPKGTRLNAFWRTAEWICVQSYAPTPCVTGFCHAAHLAPCVAKPSQSAA